MKDKMHKIIVWPLLLFLFVGFIFVGHNDILCIAEDGQMKLETECLPCCNDSDNVCNMNELNNTDDEHDGCSTCSDFTIDSTLWSKRLSKNKFLESAKLYSNSVIVHTIIENDKIEFNISKNIIQLPFQKDPPSLFIASTYLIC